MKPTLVAIAAGAVFGAGLAISGMTIPARVLDFLALRDWTLAFVMGGALLVTVPGYALAKRTAGPWFASRFPSEPGTTIDRRLVCGSAMFGLGWGLAGICPGPALANLGLFDPGIALFVVALAAGTWLAARLPGRNDPAPL